jgi:DNA-binding transcriptional regulator YiaG
MKNKKWTANRIKQLRLRKGLTQQRLAELIGLTQKAVSAWENDTRKPSGSAQVAMTQVDKSDNEHWI